MKLKSFKPIADIVYEDSRRLNIQHFAKNFAGRVTFVTLFSMNRTTTQSEYGQMNTSMARRYTKIDKFPLWNVSRHELEVSYDFENSGLTTPEVTSTAVTIDSIYTVAAGDLIEFEHYDGEAKLFQVSENENNFAMVEDYNFTLINLKLADKDLNSILANVNKELYYNFELSLMEDSSLINKYKMLPEIVELPSIIDQFNVFINEDYNMSDGSISELIKSYLYNLVEDKFKYISNNPINDPVNNLPIDFTNDDILTITAEMLILPQTFENYFLVLSDLKELNIITMNSYLTDDFKLKIKVNYAL